jgi:hypothetical protein
MRDEETEETNAEMGEYEWCPRCQEYIHFHDAQNHECWREADQ